MGAEMELKDNAPAPDDLRVTTDSGVEAEIWQRIGDEGVPMTDFLLHWPQPPGGKDGARRIWVQRRAPKGAYTDGQQREALEALIQSAFGG